MIRTLTGANQVELSRRLDGLVKDFVREHGELAVERLDGEEASAQTIIDAVASLPFLALKKLVIVRDLSANKQAAEQVEQIISSAADSTDLIFYETSPDKRTAYYKNLKSKTDLEEFVELDARQLPDWVIKYAASQGGNISRADANYLIDRLGDQRLLAGEIDKLVTYEPKISRDSIDLLTEKTPQSKIFDLLDASFAGNKKRALELYEEQRSQKAEPQEIMAMLAWQLRLITLAKLAPGKTSDDIARDINMKAFPVDKARRLAASLSLSQLRELVLQAEKIDRLSKTQTIDLDEALKTYIATL